jgi:hypothetical protein
MPFVPSRIASVTSTLLLASWAGLPSAASAQPGSPGTSSVNASRPAASAPVGELATVRVTNAPVIDGALDDEAWSSGPLALGEWLSYNPTPGDRIPQTTQVFLAHDADALYIAFRCLDPEPNRIKSGVRRRDTLFSDDWVGLSLDSLGTRQTTYDMFVNAHGMQADILTSSSQGERIEPDWVWESAGKLTPNGYDVELRIPLQSIRFKGGDNVRMGILFWRRISRLGVSVSWPTLEPGRSIFERHASVRLGSLDERRTRELVPSFTSSIDQLRETPDRFGPVDTTQDLGVSAKYGITSAVTLEATVNPDFSQVESDAFQVEVNQRFPLFFSEKRPFFMEGTDIFAVAASGNDSSFISAVHTRNIIDPIAGLKLTGNVGRVAFGVLSAADQAPGRPFEEGDPNPFEGKERYFHIARAQYSLGPGNYLGVIGTATRFGGGGNYVGGADASFKIDNHQRFQAAALYSSNDPTSVPDPESDSQGKSAGVLAQALYSLGGRRGDIGAFIEHIDSDFQMDTAFYNQTGITRGWVFAQYNFYPDQKKYAWAKKVSTFLFTQAGRDREQNGTDLIIVPAVRANLTRQGFLRVDAILGHEPWQGREFERRMMRLFAEGQVFRWLSLEGRMFYGKAIFYDEVDPYQGNSLNTSVGFTFEPTPRFTQSVEWSHVDFDRESTGEDVYVVDVVNTRSVYQFTKEFYLRAIVQFNSDEDQILTDFLASYELRPGTVIYGGYGSLIEQRAFEDEQWIPNRGAYLTTRRGLFFKASYLFRF